MTEQILYDTANTPEQPFASGQEVNFDTTEPYVLDAHEQYRLDPGEPGVNTSVDLGEGCYVHGVQLAGVRLGGADTYTDIRIVDTRNDPVNGETPAGHTIRRVGQEADGQPVTRVGDFVAVIPSADGQPPRIMSLLPGKSLRIGRGQGMVGRELMPDTVSGQHCEIGIDEDGTLIIQNLDPTNQTVVFDPSLSAEQPQPAAEATDDSPETTKPKGELSEERAIELLSYSDVLRDEPQFGDDRRSAAIEWTRNSPSGRKYTAELLDMVARHDSGLAGIKAHATRIHQEFTAAMRQLGVQPTEFGRSLSWIYWDMAKQSHLAKHPEESSADYTEQAATALTDPLDKGPAGARKRQEILARHIGWEIAQKFDSPIDTHIRAAEPLPDDDRELLPAWAQRMGLDMTGYNLLRNNQRNETGQRPSHVLHKIGASALASQARITI